MAHLLETKGLTKIWKFVITVKWISGVTVEL